ncbi:hypothetical protein HZA97_05185 [Candidatus Woesearchaeota archaeon]|nr:hypothetical protein [Candidatus Woesearchaeota archaeon]
MSLPYKLFGIPRTLDEFLDKARTKGIKKLDMDYGLVFDGGMIGSQDFYLTVFIRYKTKKGKSKEFWFKKEIISETEYHSRKLDKISKEEARKAILKGLKKGFEINYPKELNSEELSKTSPQTEPSNIDPWCELEEVPKQEQVDPWTKLERIVQ